jgi:hypothetical protein
MPPFNLPPGVLMRDIDPGSPSEDCAKCGEEFYFYDVDDDFPDLCPECAAAEKERLAVEDDVVAREGIPQTGVTIPSTKDRAVSGKMFGHRFDTQVGFTGETVVQKASRLVKSVLEIARMRRN